LLKYYHNKYISTKIIEPNISISDFFLYLQCNSVLDRRSWNWSASLPRTFFCHKDTEANSQAGKRLALVYHFGTREHYIC